MRRIDPESDRALSPLSGQATAGRLQVRAAHVSVAGLILVGLIVFIFVLPSDLLSLSSLQARRHDLQHFVRERPGLSVLIYMGLYAMVTGFSLPGALVMTLAGGFLFGMVEGALSAVAGAGFGATAMFWVARSAWGETLRERSEKAGGLASRLAASASKDAFAYILMLRLIPGVPIWIVNVTAGLVRMRTAPYIVATVLGFLPSTFAYAAVGSGLGRMFERGETPNPRLLLEPQWLGMMAGLAALALLPLASRILSSPGRLPGIWRRLRRPAA